MTNTIECRKFYDRCVILIPFAMVVLGLAWRPFGPTYKDCSSVYDFGNQTQLEFCQEFNTTYTQNFSDVDINNNNGSANEAYYLCLMFSNIPYFHDVSKQHNWFDNSVNVCNWAFITCNDENKINRIYIEIEDSKQSCGLFNDEPMINLKYLEKFIIENGNLGLEEMKASNWPNNLKYVDLGWQETEWISGSKSIKSINFDGMSQTNVDFVQWNTRATKCSVDPYCTNGNNNSDDYSVSLASYGSCTNEQECFFQCGYCYTSHPSEWNPQLNDLSTLFIVSVCVNIVILTSIIGSCNAWFKNNNIKKKSKIKMHKNMYPLHNTGFGPSANSIGVATLGLSVSIYCKGGWGFTAEIFAFVGFCFFSLGWYIPEYCYFFFGKKLGLYTKIEISSKDLKYIVFHGCCVYYYWIDCDFKKLALQQQRNESVKMVKGRFPVILIITLLFLLSFMISVYLAVLFGETAWLFAVLASFFSKLAVLQFIVSFFIFGSIVLFEKELFQFDGFYIDSFNVNNGYGADAEWFRLPIWWFFCILCMTTLLGSYYLSSKREVRSAGSIVLGFFTSMFDMLTDILVIISWYQNDDKYWASIQITFLVVSQMYSAAFTKLKDNTCTRDIIMMRLGLCCGLGKIIMGIKLWETLGDDETEENRLNYQLTKIREVLFESFPSVGLGFYIALVNNKNGLIDTAILSIIFSFINVTKIVISIYNSNRIKKKNDKQENSKCCFFDFDLDTLVLEKQKIEDDMAEVVNLANLDFKSPYENEDPEKRKYEALRVWSKKKGRLVCLYERKPEKDSSTTKEKCVKHCDSLLNKILSLDFFDYSRKEILSLFFLYMWILFDFCIRICPVLMVFILLNNGRQSSSSVLSILFIMILIVIIQIFGFWYFVLNFEKLSFQKYSKICIVTSIEKSVLILFSCVFTLCYFVFEKVFDIKFKDKPENSQYNNRLTDAEVIINKEKRRKEILRVLKYEFFTILFSFGLLLFCVFWEMFDKNVWFFSWQFYFVCFVVFLSHLLLTGYYYRQQTPANDMSAVGDIVSP